MVLAAHQRIVASTGPAAGRIHGINHLQMIVHDMTLALPFYRDLLGFKVVRTRGKITENGALVPGDRLPVTKNYFFDLGNGELMSCIEVKGMPRPDPSLYADALWPGDAEPAPLPRKVDHFSFNVDDLETLEWFRTHLQNNGIAVSEIAHARFEPATASPFISSFCFYDPSGNPLELATFDWANDKWTRHAPERWLMDEEPVPSLLQEPNCNETAARADALLAGDPALLADPFPVYAQARDEGPLARPDLLLVCTYADVREALKDPAGQSSRGLVVGSRVEAARASLTGELLEAFDEILEFMSMFPSRTDGADHLRLRRVASTLFSARNIAKLDVAAHRHTHHLIDSLLAADEPDAMLVAEGLPIRMMGELLGVPDADLPAIQAWSARLGASNASVRPEVLLAGRDALRSFIVYVDDMITRSEQGEPTELVKLLRDAEREGRLSHDELAALFVQLLFAGHETTVTLLGGGLLDLLRRPVQWRLLVEEPSRIPNAVEELLRFVSPSQYATRVTTHAGEVAGVSCPAGHTVVNSIAGANRDPAEFSEPDDLDVLRSQARDHLAFGAGPHFCLGAALARLEGVAFFEGLARRVPDIELVDANPEWTGGAMLRRLVALPVRTGARVG